MIEINEKEFKHLCEENGGEYEKTRENQEGIIRSDEPAPFWCSFGGNFDNFNKMLDALRWGATPGAYRVTYSARDFRDVGMRGLPHLPGEVGIVKHIYITVETDFDDYLMGIEVEKKEEPTWSEGWSESMKKEVYRRPEFKERTRKDFLDEKMGKMPRKKVSQGIDWREWL